MTPGRALFTEDARVEFPMARHEGVEGLAAWHRQALEVFARTQHLDSPAVVALLSEERAVLRANLVSTHVHHLDEADEPLFVAGTLVHGEARHIGLGRRLAELSCRLVWSSGMPPRPRGCDDRSGRGFSGSGSPSARRRVPAGSRLRALPA
ncbi:nuclear transport factor 2 family protein [Actinomadura sp. NEAU-AAG7]|uniref:nuclear transport factor 2 family protein n=1 Tax=Actinomadura sp. NEAU-AAG7 TaxID=2839640 RepID=UPI001BE497C0|nr:nuclear transport factor 2 family protein [Actinomadura sp. NEAU-AAG7]MBT2212494.1 nuclear transport factor 2 family protein [Actinomadura sp. NEAU-AAG7]